MAKRQTKAAIRTRVINDHRPDCDAVATVNRGTWDSPWWFTGDSVWLDSLGRKNGSGSRWLVCSCNDTRCVARMIVNEQDLLAAITKGTEPLPTEAGK